MVKCFDNFQNIPLDKTENVLTLLVSVNADVTLPCLLPIKFYQPLMLSTHLLSLTPVSSMHYSRNANINKKSPPKKYCFPR